MQHLEVNAGPSPLLKKHKSPQNRGWDLQTELLLPLSHKIHQLLTPFLPPAVSTCPPNCSCFSYLREPMRLKKGSTSAWKSFLKTCLQFFSSLEEVNRLETHRKTQELQQNLIFRRDDFETIFAGQKTPTGVIRGSSQVNDGRAR